MFKVRIVTSGLTEKENKLVKDAGAHMEACINSAEFRKFVLNYSHIVTYYSGWWPFRNYTRYLYDRFHYTDYSNREVLDLILSGREMLDEKYDAEADIYLKVDRRNNYRVIGYTYPNTRWQWVYNWVLRSWDKYDIASNLMHEYLHKQGFDHEYRYTELRQYSVPYAIGYFVGKWRPKA